MIRHARDRCPELLDELVESLRSFVKLRSVKPQRTYACHGLGSIDQLAVVVVYESLLLFLESADLACEAGLLGDEISNR